MADNVHQTYGSVTAAGVTQSQLRARIVAGLAQVRAMEEQDLWNEIVQAGGDCQMDSKETEVVISILEHEFDRELAKVEDLEPEQMTTLSAVTNLIMARL